MTGTAWQLESWNEIPVPDGLSITLTFNNRKQASGLAGIFGYRLDYTASGDRIWGTASWRTRGKVPDDRESYALNYTHRMGIANEFKLEEDRLVIFTSRGDTLVYKPLEHSSTNQ